MRLIAIECSTTSGSVALWDHGTVLERACPEGVSHSETLLPVLRALLDDAGVPLSALDAVAFGVGPGAFTGLRVACAVAQGLAVSLGVPVVPVVTLEALASATPVESGDRVMALLDARMGEVYAATYQRIPEGLMLLGDIRVCAPTDVRFDHAPCRVVGNAALVYPALAELALAAGCQVEPASLPQARETVLLAVKYLKAGQTLDPALAAPLYVRDKVAQTVAERLASGGRA